MVSSRSTWVQSETLSQKQQTTKRSNEMLLHASFRSYRRQEPPSRLSLGQSLYTVCSSVSSGHRCK